VYLPALLEERGGRERDNTTTFLRPPTKKSKKGGTGPHACHQRAFAGVHSLCPMS
jgi:hypothetical protein